MRQREGKEGGHRDDRGPEHRPCGGAAGGWLRPRELGLFSLKRRLWADFIAAFQHLKEACGKDGRDSLSGSVVIGRQVTVLNWKRVDLD